jgi:hypothetical protein
MIVEIHKPHFKFKDTFLEGVKIDSLLKVPIYMINVILASYVE